MLLVKYQFQVMCDKNCPAWNMPTEYANAITRIDELVFENSELKARIYHLESKLENQGGDRTIDTPDASDNESGGVQIDLPGSKSAPMLLKPESLMKAAMKNVKNETSNILKLQETKRERSDSAGDDQKPAQKKSQTSENFSKKPFKCSGGFSDWFI